MHGGILMDAYNISQDRKTTAEVWKHRTGKELKIYLVDQEDFKLYMYKDLINLKSEWYLRLKGK